MRVVFVSMNSVAQSEQVTYVFKMLNERFRIGIDFAYQTFMWNSEATDQAHVYVVVIGFDTIKEEGRLRRLYTLDMNQKLNRTSKAIFINNLLRYFICGLW